MNLDDLDLFKQIDKTNLLAQIDSMPEQLQNAWNLGQTLPLPDTRDVQNIILAGMGSSALSSELTAASVFSSIRLPVTVLSDYELPAYANERTLVVCVSHSGETEETLAMFDSALKRKCRTLVISTGGTLTKRAGEANMPVWAYQAKGPARSALAWMFGLQLALFSRLGLIADASSDVEHAVSEMKRIQQHLKADVIAAKNPAKRYAGQLIGRWATFVGSGPLAVVARRWKMQINLMAKAGASYDVLPDADHYAISGMLNPNETMNAHTMTLFLRAKSDHPRNYLRSDMTRQAFLLEGLNTDYVEARGNSALAHMWTLILFGDYMAYYVCMAYRIDPASNEAVDGFKGMIAK